MKAVRDSLVLGQSDPPHLSIVTSASAGPADEYAAEELRRHCHLMLGFSPAMRRRWPVTGPAIYVNDVEAAEAAGLRVARLALGPEAFHMETRNGNLYLLGGGSRGVLYAVYELLDMIGCRWFTPEVSRIPRVREMVLPPLKKTVTPPFEFRDLSFWEAGDPVWWARNRLNGAYTPLPDYMGGFVDYGLFVHTFNVLVPPATYFRKHPEYFSLIDGQRRWQGGQLCLSNPSVVRLVTAGVLEQMRAKPKATLFSVSQNDCEGYCECAACRSVAGAEGSQAGPMLRFVNAVAKATSKAFPNKLIDTLAYQYTLDVPRLTKPHSHVRVRLCPISCCQGHAFGTCEHPETRRFLRAFEGWGKLTDQIYIWHYATNFSHYILPMPDFDELHANINTYRRAGVRGVFIQGMYEDGGGAEAAELRSYLVGKLLWNPAQPVWPLVDEFLSACYGAAAPRVRRYFDIFHARVRRDRGLHPSLSDTPAHPLFQGTILDRADAALRSGEARVRGVERRRVRQLRDGVAYARLFRPVYRLEGDVYRAGGNPADRRMFLAMARRWKTAGIRRIDQGVDFDASVRKLSLRFADHPVQWLRSEDQAIAIIPAFAGRFLEWHAHGRQWLAAPNPADSYSAYPAPEGYAEHPTFAARQPGAETVRCRRQGDGLTTTIEHGEGLRTVRTCALREGSLHIASRLENRGRAPVEVTWGAGFHFMLADGGTVRFRAGDGEHSLAWRTLRNGLSGATILEGDLMPAGGWYVDIPGYRIVHVFGGDRITRAIVGKIEAEHRLALDVRTAPVSLGPGQAITMTHVVRIERR